jgi:hypothetical protein
MPAYSAARIRRLLRAADAAGTDEEKGRVFEDLICYLFERVPGITLSQRDVLNKFELESCKPPLPAAKGVETCTLAEAAHP